jgi:hypothetical protein
VAAPGLINWGYFMPAVITFKAMAKQNGLYANIAAKKRRIEQQKAKGKTPEKMRAPGAKGAPTAEDFRQAAKTARKKK